MRELDVVGVRVEMPSNAPMVLLHEVGGMSAVAEGAPLERAWRDVHTATQHLVLNSARYEVTGRILLGRDPGSPVI